MKSKDQVILAIIGCGAAVERLYMPQLVREMESGLGIIFIDRDLDRAKLYAEKYSGSYAASIKEAGERGAQGVIIATPHPSHLELAKEALDNGMQVLVEKPATVDDIEARELAAYSAKSKKHVAVNNSRRLFPSFTHVKKLFDDKTYGDIKSISISDGSPFEWPTVSGFYLTSERAKGVLLDRGSHALDIICWWLGADDSLTVVDSFYDGFNGPESTFKLKLESSTDIQIDYSVSRLFKLPNEFHIVMQNAEIRGRLFSWNEIDVKQSGGDWKTLILDSGQDSTKEYEGFIWKLLSNFIGVVRGDAIPIVTIDDVIPSVSVITRAYELAKPFQLEWYSEWAEDSNNGG
jgi:predicted dehydrogenase